MDRAARSTRDRVITYSTVGALVAAGLALPVVAYEVAGPQAQPARAVQSDLTTKKGLSKHLAGKAQLSKGLRIHGARITVETLRGKRILTYRNAKGERIGFPSKLKTTPGGGIYFSTRGLPHRFVVAVSGRSRPKSKGFGTLRAFVNRADTGPIAVSFGTTAAVATYRRADGRWSVAKSGKRAVKALRLPAWTTLGFDDRVNPVFVSPKILLRKSKGDIDKMTAKVSKAARRGDLGPKLYEGKGPRGVFGPVKVAPAFRPSSASAAMAAPAEGARLAGVAGTLLNVFDQASTLYADITGDQTGKQLNELLNDMQSQTANIAAVSEQISNLAAAQSNATDQVLAATASSTYTQSAKAFSKAYNIQQAWQNFEQLQTPPCTSSAACADISSSALNAYYAQIQTFGPQVANVSDLSTAVTTGPLLAYNGNTISQTILDYEGAQGLVTQAWAYVVSSATDGNNNATSGSGVIPDNITNGNIGIKNGMTAPLSASAVGLAQYWLGQLQVTGLLAANYVQVCPLGCPNGYPPVSDGSSASPTPSASPSSTSNPGISGLLFGAAYAVYNGWLAEQGLPQAVPQGMILDDVDDMLWANLGMTWLNNQPVSTTANPPAGASVTLVNSGQDPQVTFSSAFTGGLPGATITAAQARGYTWYMPSGGWNPQNVSNYTPCSSGTDCAANWTSPQLGNSLGNNTGSGLLTVTGAANPTGNDFNAQWDYLGALPTGNGALLQGIAEAGSAGYFWGQAPPVWMFNPQYGIYTVAQGNALMPFTGTLGQSLPPEYYVPDLPTGTPNWLLYTPVSDTSCYAWTSVSAQTPPSPGPTPWPTPTAAPQPKCS